MTAREKEKRIMVKHEGRSKETKAPAQSEAPSAEAAASRMPSPSRGGTRAARAPDPQLVKAMRSGEPERVLRELASRLEAGRLRHVEQTEKALAAEVKILESESRRLEEEEPENAEGLAEIRGMIAGVHLDRAGTGRVRTEMEQAIQPGKDEWTVVGRVVTSDGRPAEGAEVVFVDADGQPVEALGAITADEYGMVRESFPAAVVKKLADKGTKVAAAVRRVRRIVATDRLQVPVRGNALHQFTLRVDASAMTPAIKPREG